MDQHHNHMDLVIKKENAVIFVYIYIDCYQNISGIFGQKVIMYVPSEEKMRYLKVGGHCNGGLFASITSSQKSCADVPPKKENNMVKNL